MGLCSLSCYGFITNENREDFLKLPQDTEIPIKNRKQTDISCFLILMLFFIFLVMSMLAASVQGDIRRLIYGYDDKGNICGYKNERIEGINGSGMDFTKEKYLQITKYCRYLNECWTERLCVEECKNGVVNSSIIPQCVINADDPNITTALTMSFEMVMTDLSLCWREIIALCLLSIFLSGMILMILPMYPKIAIKIIFIIVSIAATVFAVLAWTLCIKMFSLNKISFNDWEKGTWTDKTFYFLVAAIFATVFSVMILIVPCSLKPRVKLVSILFEEASKCIKCIPVVFLLPVLMLLLNAVFTCFMVFGFFFLITSGKAELNSEEKVSFPNNILFQITAWLLLFAFYWVIQFFLACQNLAITGTVSSWYFSRENDKLINPVWRSFLMITKHHLGSAAFGSLLTDIFKPFQFLHKLLQGRDVKNPVSFWDHVQYLLRIVSKNAYIMIVLLGEPFCSSACKASTCIASEPSVIALLLKTKSYMLVIVEFLLAFCVTFLGEALMMNIKGIQFFWIPSSIVFILSFYCCHVFFSVHSMTIDTIIMCFCVDHQINNGVEKPYYMNKKLEVLFQEDDPSTIVNKGNGNDATENAHTFL